MMDECVKLGEMGCGGVVEVWLTSARAETGGSTAAVQDVVVDKTTTNFEAPMLFSSSHLSAHAVCRPADA